MLELFHRDQIFLGIKVSLCVSVKIVNNTLNKTVHYKQTDMETVTTGTMQLKGKCIWGFEVLLKPLNGMMFYSSRCVLFHPNVGPNAFCWHRKKNTFLTWKFNWLYAKKCHRWIKSKTCTCLGLSEPSSLTERFVCFLFLHQYWLILYIMNDYIPF